MKFFLTLLTTGVQLVIAADIDRDAMFNWYQGLDAKNVLYAVSCGSDEAVTDVNGIVY